MFRIEGMLLVSAKNKPHMAQHQDYHYTEMPLEVILHTTVKCRCNERQYNEMLRIVKLFLGPFPFPYLMCVKTFHFNEFRIFSIMN